MSKCSILIPVRNHEPEWLMAAIKSCDQPGCDEIVIIDDNEPNRRLQQISGCRILNNPGPPGVAGALNFGLNQCWNNLVARLDADDRMFPNRLQTQIARMLEEPNLAVLGTHAIIEQGANLRRCPELPKNNVEMTDWMIYGRCPLLHPTIMLRRPLIGANPYPTDLPHAEDLGMYSRLLLEGVMMENMTESLTVLRKHPDRVSILHAQEQAESASRIYSKWQNLGAG